MSTPGVEQLSSRLSQLDESFNFLFGKQKSDKVLQQTKQNKQTTIFSAKNSDSEPNFTKFEQKVRFGQFFL